MNNIFDLCRSGILQRAVLHRIDIRCNTDGAFTLPRFPEFTYCFDSGVVDIRYRITDGSRNTAVGKFGSDSLDLILITRKDRNFVRPHTACKILFDIVAYKLDLVCLSVEAFDNRSKASLLRSYQRRLGSTRDTETVDAVSQVNDRLRTTTACVKVQVSELTEVTLEIDHVLRRCKTESVNRLRIITDCHKGLESRASDHFLQKFDLLNISVLELIYDNMLVTEVVIEIGIQLTEFLDENNLVIELDIMLTLQFVLVACKHRFDLRQSAKRNRRFLTGLKLGKSLDQRRNSLILCHKALADDVIGISAVPPITDTGELCQDAVADLILGRVLKKSRRLKISEKTVVSLDKFHTKRVKGTAGHLFRVELHARFITILLDTGSHFFCTGIRKSEQCDLVCRNTLFKKMLDTECDYQGLTGTGARINTSLAFHKINDILLLIGELNVLGRCNVSQSVLSKRRLLIITDGVHRAHSAIVTGTTRSRKILVSLHISLCFSLGSLIGDVSCLEHRTA